MIDSRCGIVCSECEFRESKGCEGCVTMQMPFWGEECPIKTCCETKGLAFCGECEFFPCDILFQYSFDAEHGDQGLRIEQCRRWARERETERETETAGDFT